MDNSKLDDALEQARLIELRTRKTVQEQLSGGYRSVFRGRGMDFEEVREYVAGDDVRAIDWSVTARAGRPFVKMFREERELTIILAVDLSASGIFGSGRQSKRELAAELACMLGLAALHSRDKLGVLLFSDRVERFIPPGSGRGHVLRAVSELLSARPEGRGTDLAGALAYLSSVVRRRAAVVLLSDLIVPSIEETRVMDALRATAHRHELIALWLQDPHELTVPSLGQLALEDAESGEVVLLDTSRRSVRERFAQLASARRDARRRELRSAGVRTLELDVAVDCTPRLVAFFSGRLSAEASS